MNIIWNKTLKSNIYIVIFTLVSILTVSYIFSNSCQKPVKSNEKSDYVAQKVQPIVDPEMNIEEDDFRKYTRKAAHVIEFGMLGVSLGIVFACVYAKSKRLFVSMPLLICLSVGIVDEFIQKFFERTSSVKDVLIDFAGSVAGLLLLLIVLIPFVLKKKRKNV